MSYQQSNLKNKVIASFCILLVLFCLIAPFTPLLDITPFPEQLTEKPLSSKQDKRQIEQPLHQVVLPDFAAIRNVKEKKRQFFTYVKPAIIAENEKLTRFRLRIKTIVNAHQQGKNISEKERKFIKQLAEKYRVDITLPFQEKLQQLLLKVDVVPTSLVLVQAANESAWGTSRFVRIGLNFFGVWCYEKGCGVIPNQRIKNASHEVKKYQTVQQSIADYMFNLNSNTSYTEFRQIRANLRAQQKPLSAKALAAGLINYSERGQAYIDDIRSMLRHNEAYFK